MFNNINPIGMKTLAEFTARAKAIREIQNTQITGAEIDLLIEGHQKLDSTIISVVSARLQQVAESGGAQNWCVFSSWLWQGLWWKENIDTYQSPTHSCRTQRIHEDSSGLHYNFSDFRKILSSPQESSGLGQSLAEFLLN